MGGHAVAFHGHPRATKDMDVLIKANTNNAERVYRALAAFDAPLDALDERKILPTSKLSNPSRTEKFNFHC